MALTLELLVATALGALAGWLIGRPVDPGPRDRPPATVELRCPETGKTIANEHTLPDERDGDKAAYNCPACPHTHVYRWGPPAPLYVGDRDPPIRYPNGRRLVTDQ